MSLLRMFLLLAVIGSSVACGEEDEFQPRQVVAPFEAITNAKSVPVDKSDLRKGELVLGVSLGGEARAYPINMLTNPTREIINDHLGGQAIAATW